MAKTAIAFRMPAGIPGAVNRSHPLTVVPYQNDATIPVLLYGLAVAVNAGKNGVRNIQPADSATTYFGMSVRPFPIQQGQASSDFAPAAFGVAGPFVSQAVDVMKSGFIMVQVNSGAPGLGDPVFIWAAASAAPHVQGGIEASNPGGSGFQIAGAFFNGSPDATGVAEVAVNP